MAAPKLSGGYSEKSRESVNQSKRASIGLSSGVLINVGFEVWILSRSNSVKEASMPIYIRE